MKKRPVGFIVINVLRDWVGDNDATRVLLAQLEQLGVIPHLVVDSGTPEGSKFYQQILELPDRCKSGRMGDRPMMSISVIAAREEDDITVEGAFRPDAERVAAMVAQAEQLLVQKFDAAKNTSRAPNYPREDPDSGMLEIDSQ
jgi:hypothetical protein